MGYSDITFFTTFKGFDDNTDSIGQQSAIYSWIRERFNANPILAIGDGVGVADFCKQKGLTLVPNVVRARDRGLRSDHPMLRDFYRVAIENTHTTYICLINSDIIVSPGFHSGLGTLLFANQNPFVIGIRYDIALSAPVVDEQGYVALWQRSDVSLHGGGGSDYFACSTVFAKQMLSIMPDYVMGAAAWDNWMHWVGLNRSASPICTMNKLRILHPNHIYRQLSAGTVSSIYEHPAVQHNMKIYKASSQRAGSTDGRWRHL